MKYEFRMIVKHLLLISGIVIVSATSFSQKASWDTSKLVIPELKYNFNKSGSHYFKGTFLAQTWARYSEMNPGSAIDGYALGWARGDIGIRRLRIQAYGQLTDRLFFYTQFGQNNLNSLQPRHVGSFFHDVVTEYKIAPQFQLGGGLTGWSGMSRYSSPAVAGILSLDAPLYQQATNGVNDQFVRKLSLYAKGEIAQFQYRVAVSNPFTTKNSVVPVPPLGNNSSFSLEPPKVQTSGYLVWQFLKDKDAMAVPYLPGTYLGKKKILNLGAGWVQQDKAMWHRNDSGDTVRTSMVLLGIDVFTELLVGKKGSFLTAYLAYNNFDFGKNYLRMNGVMNPANGVQAGQGSLNGAGVAYPMIGTGNTLYTQIGYKFRDNLLPDNGTLQPYICVQYSDFQALEDPSVMYEGGINWLIHGTHTGKLTLGVQNRPVFDTGSGREQMRKNMYVLQYQISL